MKFSGWFFYMNKNIQGDFQICISVPLKIALGVRSAMFSVTGSNSLHLKIFRFFTIFEKKLFRVSVVSDSVFKISPFHLYWLYLWCVICLKIKVSLISRKACCQLRFLYLRFHKRYTVIHLPTIKNFIFFCSISRKIIAKPFFFFRKLLCHERHLITSNILNFLRSMLI